MVSARRPNPEPDYVGASIYALADIGARRVATYTSDPCIRDWQTCRCERRDAANTFERVYHDQPARFCPFCTKHQTYWLGFQLFTGGRSHRLHVCAGCHLVTADLTERPPIRRVRQ